MKNIDKLLVSETSDSKAAMNQINENGLGIVFVISDGKVAGSLTDGDIRRNLLEGGDIKSSVVESMNDKPIILTPKSIKEESLRIRPNLGNIIVPVVNTKDEIIDIISVFDDGRVVSFKEKPESSVNMINGGFMVFNMELMDYLTNDEDCDFEFNALETLATKGEVMVYKHSGSWEYMDHERDVAHLNLLWDENRAFWRKW